MAVKKNLRQYSLSRKKVNSLGNAARYACWVKLTPFRSKIRYEIMGRVYCQKSKQELANHGTYGFNDQLWKNLFRTPAELQSFVKRKISIKRRVDLSTLLYDDCDVLIRGD